MPLKCFSEAETREIVFKTVPDGESHHTVQLDGATPGDGFDRHPPAGLPELATMFREYQSRSA